MPGTGIWRGTACWQCLRRCRTHRDRQGEEHGNPAFLSFKFNYYFGSSGDLNLTVISVVLGIEPGNPMHAKRAPNCVLIPPTVFTKPGIEP